MLFCSSNLRLISSVHRYFPIEKRMAEFKDIDDEVWRAERRANFPRLQAKRKVEEEEKPKKDNQRKRPNSTRNQITLFDKIFLTEVHKREDDVMKCLEILSDIYQL